MAKRGRKSSAELTVVSGQAIAPPDPPEHFDEEHRSLWISVVDSKPYDWWDGGTLPLLESYVRTVIEHRKISKLVEAFHPIEKPSELRDYKDAHAIMDKMQSQLARLATKMRLSQQSKYGARAADTADKNSAPSKPWR